MVNWGGGGGRRRILLAGAAAALVVAVLLAVSGGTRFTVGGLRVSARSPLAPSLAAIAMLAVWAWLASRRHEAGNDLTAFWSGLDRSARTIVAGLAAVSAGMAISFGTFTAAGADASGYLSQASMWAASRLGLSDPLPLMAGWPPDAGMTAPLGWNASLERGWQVPTYGPGLPLLMAAPLTIGGSIAACLIVAIAAAIAVAATGAIAFRLCGRTAAIVAAVALATCPVFVFQSVQPMSDVPVTAAWMVGWALLVGPASGIRPAFARPRSDELPPSQMLRRTVVALAEAGRRGLAEVASGHAGGQPASSADVGHDFSPAPGIRQPASSAKVGHDFSRAFLAGVACAIAVLIRPNLAPLAAVPCAYLLVQVRGTRGTFGTHPNGTPGTRGTLGTHPFGTPGTLGTLGTFVLPIALAGIFLAWLQWHWYGSPFRSGYGTVEQLYSFGFVGANATRYATWLISTSPILLLALAGVWIRREAATWALAAFAALNAAAYLVYFAFNEWSYLRFLLPALAIASVFTGVAVAALVERVGESVRAPVLLAAVLVIAGVGVSRARALDGFRLADAHRRVLQIDRYLESALPDRSVIVAGEQSGAVRFDTGHPIVRWEAASRDDFMTVLTLLEADRRPVWILLDAWEEPLVRAKFGGIDAAALDWPPAVDAGETHRTRAWNLSDRARYLKGERVVTDRLR